jgi:hypothetical protein
MYGWMADYDPKVECFSNKSRKRIFVNYFKGNLKPKKHPIGNSTPFSNAV